MSTWIPVIVGLGILAVAMDQFALWLERKGWLYYRHKKGSGGNSSLSGGIVTQFQGIFEPETHILEQVESEETMTQVEKEFSGDGSGDEKLSENKNSKP